MYANCFTAGPFLEAWICLCSCCQTGRRSSQSVVLHIYLEKGSTDPHYTDLLMTQGSDDAKTLLF